MGRKDGFRDEMVEEKISEDNSSLKMDHSALISSRGHIHSSLFGDWLHIEY